LVSNGGDDLHIRRNASTLTYRSPGKGLDVYNFSGGVPAGTLTVNTVASGNFVLNTPHLLVATAGEEKNYSAFWLGNPGTTIGGFWRGSVAEMIVYDGVLTPDGLASVGWYLQNKYGLATTLPPPKPFVRSLSASQGTVTSSVGLLSAPGQAVALNWNVENADTVSIDQGVLVGGTELTGSRTETGTTQKASLPRLRPPTLSSGGRSAQRARPGTRREDGAGRGDGGAPAPERPPGREDDGGNRQRRPAPPQPAPVQGTTLQNL
jgi:hypothetical protein